MLFAWFDPAGARWTSPCRVICVTDCGLENSLNSSNPLVLYISKLVNPPFLEYWSPETRDMKLIDRHWVLWVLFLSRSHRRGLSRVPGPLLSFSFSVPRLITEWNQPVASLQGSAPVNIYPTIPLIVLLLMAHGCTPSVVSSCIARCSPDRSSV